MSFKLKTNEGNNNYLKYAKEGLLASSGIPNGRPLKKRGGRKGKGATFC